MKLWGRRLAYVAIIAVIAVAYFIGRAGRGTDDADAAARELPDPGYAARDAEVIETGDDGRERYRLNARVIRQNIESGVIELENLEMDYHPGAQPRVPGEAPFPTTSNEIWHLTSDRGQVRAEGDDVQLTGNVRVTGPAPGSGEAIVLSTSELRINTPTQYIETRAPVRLSWSGHQLDAKGLKADLKAGTLSLESDVNGSFSKN
jgi:lipopolysaccharide export system protein LptC